MGRRIGTVLLVWAATALALSLAGVPARAPGPVLQKIVLGLMFLFVAAAVVSAPFRLWALSLNLRRLTTFHLWRIVPGIAFLVLYAQGELPAAFALPAGYGDTAIAVTASFAAMLAPPTTNGRRAALTVWHVLGFLDLVNVVATAARLTLAQPGSMDLLRHFPLSLLPLFLVPLTLMAHLIALAQLWTRQRTSEMPV